MSESSALVMASHEPLPLQASSQPPHDQHQHQHPHQQQQMRAPYAETPYNRPVGSSPPPPYQPVPLPVANHVMGPNSGDQKRKRGRPRKYGPDGNMSSGGVPAPVPSGPQPISSVSNAQAQAQVQAFSSPVVVPPQVQMENQTPVGGSGSPNAKKSRGRPPGSSNKKKQVEPIGSTGIGFIPHVINVNPGEDVSTKIMAFSQNGPRAVCILSANGAISNVTLRQAATSGGTATYEGRFDILSLSGSFMLAEVGGQQSRTGGLSTTLAGHDGRVLGGCVAGLLIAATPVQVIVGSFLADSSRREPKQPGSYMDPLSASGQPKVNMGGGGSSSPSRGTFSESSGGPASPLNLSSGAYNNNHSQAMSSMPWK